VACSLLVVSVKASVNSSMNVFHTCSSFGLAVPFDTAVSSSVAFSHTQSLIFGPFM
jgi:hypothetical protein